MNETAFGKASTMNQAPATVVYAKGKDARTRWGYWIVNEHPVKCPDTGKIIRCEKYITVDPMASLSGQTHFGRGGKYIALEGTTMVYVNGRTVGLNSEHPTIEIPRGSLHFSWSEKGSKFHEIQQGPNCDENDIMRCADKYKNASEMNSDADIIKLMIRTAKDRFETEDIEQSFVPHDFMPDVLDIIADFNNDFNAEGAVVQLTAYFQAMIDDCKRTHRDRTPTPIKEPKTELKK